MRGKNLIFLSFLCLVQASSQDTKENADFKLAVNLYNDKLYDLALEQFRQFINLYPNTQNGIEARFYLGLAQSKQGNHEDARVTFQNFALAYPENPKAPDAWWNVAEACIAINNLREAALAFERVKSFHPKSKQAPAALQKAAELFERLKDRESAKKILRSLTQEYASLDVLPARLKLAEFLTEEAQFDAARNEYKVVADASKDNNLKARALVMMAGSLVSLGRLLEAETALNQVIANLRTSTSYHAALLALGRLKKTGGSLNEALAAWKNISDDSVRAPKQVRQDALIELGEVSGSNGEYNKALTYFERAAAIRAERGGLAFHKAGMVAERLNNLSYAGDLYARAYADTSPAVDKRGILIGAFKGAKFSKNYAEAERIARRYSSEYPLDARTDRMILESAQMLHKELNDPRQAIELCQELIKRFPRSSVADDAAFGLGIALRAAGEFEKAIGQLESLPKKFPSSEFVKQARDEVERIRLFDLKDREAGQERLALLIGDVIQQKSKGDLAFRLAEIYFHHLKDYTQAAAQYQAALAADLDPAKRPAAWFYQARSYEYLARKQNVRNAPYAAKSITSFDSLLKKFPSSEFTDDAQIAQFQLKLQAASNASEARKVGTEFLSIFPNSRRKDLALLALGNSYQSAKNYGDAALAYKMILEKQPRSDVAVDALFHLGSTLFSMGDKDSSAKVVNQFILAEPNHERSAQAAFLLATVAADRGKSVEAVGWYDRIERVYFYTNLNQDLDLKRGETYYASGEYERAVTSFQKHLEALSQDYFRISDVPADLIYKLAFSLEKLGNRRDAKRYYSEFLLREPASDRTGTVYYALAGIARAENKIDQATRYLQEASRFGSFGSDDRVVLETAELLFKNEQYTEAIAKFSEVAGKTKNDSLQQRLQARIIVCYMRLDNMKEAEKRIAGFLKSAPTASVSMAEFEFERGKYHLRKDELEKAGQRFELVRRQYPTSSVIPETMYWVARAHELREQPQYAIQVYDSILLLYPTNSIVPRTQLSLGNVYYNLEQWDPAAKLFKTILDHADRSPDLVQYAMNNLILTYKELNLFDAALEMTRKYIAQYPDDPGLIDKRIDIGVLYQKLGYYEQSVLHLQKLLETSSSEIEPEVRYYIGEAFFFKGDFQQAILEFLKVPYMVGRRGKVDWTATSYYMAGQSYEKMAKYDQAVTMYRQIIERPGIDVAFKTAAQKEIERVKTIERRN